MNCKAAADKAKPYLSFKALYVTGQRFSDIEKVLI
jgi:hypothetical protein